MKTLLPLLLVPLLLSGCKDKDQAGDWAAESAAAAVKEAKDLKGLNSKLKESLRQERQRTAELEARLADLAAKSQTLVDKTRALAASHSVLETLRDAQLQAETEPAPPTRMTDEEKLAAYEAGGIAGVEAQAAREIIRKAKMETTAWRSVFEIEREARGWLIVQAFSTTVTQMPTKVRDEIVAAAKRENPASWSATAAEVTRQADAWNTLEEWRKTNVPGLNRQQSVAVVSSAIARYPSDWSMALFVINDEVKRLAK